MDNNKQANLKNNIVIRFIMPIILGIGLIFGIWFVIYSDKADAKGPRYVLWKHGLYPFDPQVVYDAMVSDGDRNSIVKGLTLDQLRNKFGTIQKCTYECDKSFKDQEFYWLGERNDWLVQIENGHAIELRHIKG